MNYEFKHLAVGGTFDQLHNGHKAFLKFAFKMAWRVSIGLTTDKMARQNGKNSIQLEKVRMANLNNFLHKEGFYKRHQIVMLNDIYGSAANDKTLEGLIATKLSILGAKEVNLKREKNGLKPLVILICPLVFDDTRKVISSTRFREGIISREGFNYYHFLNKYKKFALPFNLRSELSGPLGDVYPEINHNIFEKSNGLIVTVGDESTKTLNILGIRPHLSIIDFKVGRHKVYKSLSDLGFSKTQRSKTVRNRPRTIERSLILTIWRFFRQNDKKLQVIKVLGEEDLAVIPIVLLSPLNTNVIYGQRGKGLVYIKVNENEKERFLGLIKRFKAT